MTIVRVALDLDGSLEALTNSMGELADALRQRPDLELETFHSRSSSHDGAVNLRGRGLWAPWWRRGMGPSIAAQLGSVDVVHVAGPLTPPTGSIPLVVSVDDLRPFRENARSRYRGPQLLRCVARGARIVTSSRAAAHEMQDVLGLERAQVTVVRPPVATLAPTIGGNRLVVNVAGQIDRFLVLAPLFSAFATEARADLVVIGSSALAARVRSRGLKATFVHRAHASDAIGHARVVVTMSDGARFPAFAIAALGAGVPTLARATESNRELLGGAAALVFDDEELEPLLRALWYDETRRAIAIAAGRDRAQDFSPRAVASVYAALYADVAKGSR